MARRFTPLLRHQACAAICAAQSLALCVYMIAIPQAAATANDPAKIPLPASDKAPYRDETLLIDALKLKPDLSQIVMDDILAFEPSAGAVEGPTIRPVPKPAQIPPRQMVADLQPIPKPPIARDTPAETFAASDTLRNEFIVLTQDQLAPKISTDDTAFWSAGYGVGIEPIVLLPEDWLDIDVRAQTRPTSLFSPEQYAQLETPQLTKDQSFKVIDTVGLPGDAQVICPDGAQISTLVASAQNTSAAYEAKPIGMGGVETLRDAVEHAIATNPDVKIAEARQEDAYYAVREARAGFLPKLDLNAGAGPEISRQSGAEEIVRIRQELNATLRQTVFDFGLTQYDYLRAKEGYEAAKLDTLQSIETLVYDVSIAYLGVLQQQGVVALAQDNIDAHEGILALVTAQKEAGQGTAADVNRVASSLANARSFMLEEESKLQQARDQYRRLLNAPPGVLVDPALNLGILPQTADEAATRIVTESPQLLRVKADTKSIQNQLRSQRGNYFPRVELEVQGNMNTDVAGETGQVRDARAMMYLRYNLYNGGADAAVSSRLRARVKEVGFEFEKQRREVEQNIRNDFTAIEASRAKVETIDQQVKAAKEVVRLYEQQFRSGDRSAFDLLDAQQASINAKLEQILNTYQETRAGFRVLQQLGSLYYALTAE